MSAEWFRFAGFGFRGSPDRLKPALSAAERGGTTNPPAADRAHVRGSVAALRRFVVPPSGSPAPPDAPASSPPPLVPMLQRRDGGDDAPASLRGVRAACCRETVEPPCEATFGLDSPDPAA